MKLYIGTYTRDGESQGIYQCQIDERSGEIKLDGLAAKCENPAYLCIGPSLQTLYVVNEVNKFNNKPEGAITAFHISNDGNLQNLGTVMSGSQGPCHLVMHPNGNLLFVSNYGGGSISSLSCNQDGSLKECQLTIPHRGSSINPLRQEGPHPHSVNLSHDGKYLYVPDLGIDKIMYYQVVEEKEVLRACGQVEIAPGAGPRHFCFHPTGRVAYVINELASTVTAFAFHRENGDLQEMQTVSTLPKDFKGETSTAHIVAHPNGRFLYGSNRGHDSIAVFAVGGDGRIQLIRTEPTLGQTPRNFTITGDGKFLIVANQDSNSLVSFFIDLDTGLLEPTGSLVNVPSPVCVLSVE